MLSTGSAGVPPSWQMAEALAHGKLVEWARMQVQLKVSAHWHSGGVGTCVRVDIAGSGPVAKQYCDGSGTMSVSTEL